MDNTAQEICAILSNLENNKGTLNSHCWEIASAMLPSQKDFFVVPNASYSGEKRTEGMLDSIGNLCLNIFAALYESVTTPRDGLWHKLTVTDYELMQNREVLEWLDTVNGILYDKRYSPRSNFAGQNHENILSIGAFGTSIMYTEDMVDYISYKACHLSECNMLEDPQGIIDSMYRKYSMSAKQAYQKFGDTLPAIVLNSLERQPDQLFRFVHCVRPNDEYNPTKLDYRGKKYTSFHVFYDEPKILSVGGYRTFPFHVNRYTKAPNEVYGRSPGMIALPDLKMLFMILTDKARANRLALSPPLLAQNNAEMRDGISIVPAAVNYGGLDALGNPTIKPFNSGAVLQAADMDIERITDRIRDIFMVKLFTILNDTPQMTATEVLQREAEKGALLTPAAGRAQSEYLAPMITRELDIYEHRNMLPDRPDVMKNFKGDFKVEFTSPLNSLQKATQQISAQRWISQIVSLMQVDPAISDMANFQEYIKLSHKAGMIPEKLLRSDADIAMMAQNRAQQQQQQQMVSAAPDIAKSIKDIAQAENYAR